MEIKDLKGAIEAILFASGDPVEVKKIAEVLSIDKKTTERLIQSLSDEYLSKDKGIEILKLEDKYQMCTKSKYGKYVRDIMNQKRNIPLSQAALEVLAIIAYNEPVTKAYLEQIRGVDCSGVIGGLVLRGLIEERGRLELPGKPLIYGTTPNFLRCFKLISLDMLPPTAKTEEKNKEELIKAGIE
jgi:segregation and condensation protein B